MRLAGSVADALNEQISLEASASSSYLAAASWCEITGYDGGAAYFYAQSDEERTHMLKLVHYLNGMGTPAVIPRIEAPAASYDSLESAIKAALESERRVTAAIHGIVDTASKEGDHSTRAFLEWYVNEQVQEETKFEAILQKFDILGRDKLAVHEIDKILAADAAAEPAAEPA